MGVESATATGSHYSIGDPVEWVSSASGSLVAGVVVRLWYPDHDGSNEYTVMLLDSGDGRDHRGQTALKGNAQLRPEGTQRALNRLNEAVMAAWHTLDEESDERPTSRLAGLVRDLYEEIGIVSEAGDARSREELALVARIMAWRFAE